MTSILTSHIWTGKTSSWMGKIRGFCHYRRGINGQFCYWVYNSISTPRNT